MKVDILAIGVHPDDIELSCSGYLLKEIDKGKKVALLDLTWGELGTRGNGLLRKKEALASAKKMGAIGRDFLNIGDGFFESNAQNLKLIISMVRKWQPTIVLANAEEDRHPDHARAAQLTARACFLSGLIKITTKYNGRDQSAWRPQAVYHYIQDNPSKPDILVDITGFIDQKMELIKTFKSQFYNANSKEPESPISSKEFLDYQIARAKVFGRYLQVPYAEGFTSSRPVGVDSLFSIF